jgi:hypothetical protein
MRKALGSIAVALAALGTGEGLAAEHEILGKRLLLRDPRGAEARRSVVIVGRESETDVPALVGDPVASGATLQVGLDGGSAGQSFVLEASGWSRTATGFRYAGPTGGEPVQRVVLRRSAAGRTVLEIVLHGRLGSEPLTIVPPDPGSEAVAILTLGNGDAYCTALGGAAGGRVMANTEGAFRMVNATAEPGCPKPCCGMDASCLTGDGLDAAICSQIGGTLAPPGAVCDNASGACASPPAGAGNCCDLGFGALCAGGPGFEHEQCDELFGSFAAGAVCDGGGCAVR